ncbi:bifunctional phosphopantothenoylcysteine decarboxylase/phosphopantothenate--cysteine ligase CoaBC [Pullulanibacillus sp. KACC 23026]|uniref:bifunctional phosphopantothenoylcysteine decarboxylase/phosphopantothenate--cysteine ligase CoaBC n=1 Tax=Pullulanibacillus sp. KACC 23026 TaxID=3028315 RepID=UPI0023AFE04C|nr:bifunctional phosphopantothenoylcysteine decarboxylase/phosphopantothenate--cysteine ligase CoaBC [Pullulanibacillus sp. KACC 23026]WEG11631.1 bifunctional phosphopantothenoylcysteine decarboxylase/phosphopantothenate--cysteine ligase CoaBC [Pullulanibacillus sp. KACC 23026]
MRGKTILLAVAGGIAAFKAAALTSMLTKAGASVHVLMTSAAKEFVGVQTFQALSRNPVYDDTFTEKVPHQIAHIDLADKADLILVAPATANIIAKLASGQADDMVTTTILASKAPVWVAPAMNVNMYDHPAVRDNLNRLKSFGYEVFEPGEGLLACGWIGKGRLPEPEDLFSSMEDYFFSKEHPPLLRGKRIMITAGPTREPIDPVRYITNYSSGKMGYALAKAAKRLGAHVTLIAGPTDLKAPAVDEFVPVVTTADMYEAANSRFAACDAVIKSAAVADYRPKQVLEKKYKKTAESTDWSIELVENPDILKSLGERKKTNQVLIGFAAETNDLMTNALAKIAKKNLDAVVANDVSQSGIGFHSDENEVTIFFKNGTSELVSQRTKDDVAYEVCKALARLLNQREEA